MINVDAKTPYALVNLLMTDLNIQEIEKFFEDSASLSRLQLTVATEKSDVYHLEVNSDSVLYPIKGKIAVCKLIDGTISSTDDQIFLLNTGEAYYKKPGFHLMIYPFNGECELIIWNFAKSLSDKPIKDLKSLEMIFKKTAKELDDYYLGYDERYAKVYESGADLWESDQPNDSLVEALKKHPYLIHGQVLDLGCGEGRDSIYLAKLGADITGVDVSRVALNKAREKSGPFSLSKLRFVESNVIYLNNFGNSIYDFAMNMGCLHMLTETRHRNTHLRRVSELLKPGGYFLVDHCMKNWGKGFYSIPDYDKVAKDLIPGKSIPRRIRVKGGEKEIFLRVLPYSEKQEKELIEEISKYGFTRIDSWVNDTEAFGNSSTLLFRKNG
jgi:ubiquinone/menaquinone biosynthesis C-methylase UbiE